MLRPCKFDTIQQSTLLQRPITQQTLVWIIITILQKACSNIGEGVLI